MIGKKANIGVKSMSDKIIIMHHHIKGRRVTLRPWRETDAERLFRLAADPEVGPRAGWLPHRSVSESRQIIKALFINVTTWAIARNDTDEVIGAIGYGPSCDCALPAREGEPTVGYWVGREFWGQGFCTEALQLMVDHIRHTTTLPSLISGHFADNPTSGRVMEKCGFKPTGETCTDPRLAIGGDKPIRVWRLDL